MSSDLPPIGVIIPTFNREQVVCRVLTGLKAHLRYAGQINYYVSTDGTDNTEVEVARTFGDQVYVTHGPKRGLGANLNHLLHGTQEELILQLDDDHLLLTNLELDRHVVELLSCSEAAWIRLMGIGSHNYHAQLRHQYWFVDWDSPELYIPSNRPHLKHKRFHEVFGYYPEGVSLAVTEEGFCHQCRDKVPSLLGIPPQVLVPLNSNSESAWDHIGASWQLKGY